MVELGLLNRAPSFPHYITLCKYAPVIKIERKYHMCKCYKNTIKLYRNIRYSTQSVELR